MKKYVAIIGARPQFIKHAPILFALKNQCEIVTIHTGQHYDYRMSQVFFDQLSMPKPAYNLNSGGGLHGEMTGRMLQLIEPILMDEKPDAVIVYGDTNSTLAGALTAAKLSIPVFHIEAGLRSYNREMPEEINRVMTDHLSSLLIAPSEQAIQNLQKEGIQKNVYKTGDVMCDMIRIGFERNILQKKNERFYYATLHRPYNTDNENRLKYILEIFNTLPMLVRFFIHPRTKSIIDKNFNTADYSNIHFEEPLSYFDNINELYNSSCVLTDSGGVQKEAYILKKKCITIRKETEWVETLRGNWNNLVWENLDLIPALIQKESTDHQDNLYGDGHASEEILKLFNQYFRTN
ncbi:MAG: UDP-N-acetylglucosamine 2-epimerase (non-hydrolyzing) [Bacteroidota bacterium]|nr:UDP-N-acetylglucosamine 2-epimerase (non-hydrolyzing) [Bacteroidota bacterium]